MEFACGERARTFVPYDLNPADFYVNLKAILIFLEKININKFIMIDGCCSPRRKLLLQKPLPYKYHRDSYVRVCHSK